MADERVDYVVEQVIERGWNERDPSAIDEVVAEDYVRHQALGTLVSADEFKAWIAAVTEAIPDFHVNVDEVVSDRGRGAVRFTASGKGLGAFIGSEGQEPLDTVEGIVFVHVVDGLLREEWEVLDTLSSAR